MGGGRRRFPRGGEPRPRPRGSFRTAGGRARAPAPSIVAGCAWGRRAWPRVGGVGHRPRGRRARTRPRGLGGTSRPNAEVADDRRRALTLPNLLPEQHEPGEKILELDAFVAALDEPVLDLSDGVDKLDSIRV